MLQYSWLHFCTVHEMNLNATVWSSTFELFKMPINFNSSQFKFFTSWDTALHLAQEFKYF